MRSSGKKSLGAFNFKASSYLIGLIPVPGRFAVIFFSVNFSPFLIKDFATNDFLATKLFFFSLAVTVFIDDPLWNRPSTLIHQAPNWLYDQDQVNFYPA